MGEQRPGQLGGHQGGARAIKRLPEAGGHVAQAGEGPAHAGGKLTSPRRGEAGHGPGGAIRGVGVTIGAHLLILPPLGASVLEPDLQQKARISNNIEERTTSG